MCQKMDDNWLRVSRGACLCFAYALRFTQENAMSQARKLSTVRVFADNFQFYIYDPSKDPFEPMPALEEPESRRGWTRNDNSIWYFTVGELNDHRVDIYLADAYEECPSAERLLVHNLSVKKALAVYDHEEESTVEVPSGDYAVYLRAFNLGVEEEGEDEDVEDDAFLLRDDLERYEIVLVPGSVETEGVIAGKPTLY